MTTFGERLDAAIDTHGSVCVGIDPHTELLRSWGLRPDIEGLAAFTATCVSAFAGKVAVVKPQSAFFEVFGSAGISVLERAVHDLRAAGTLVLLDVKRGDIGSTMDAYANAYLHKDAPIAVDAITASPFLGVGSLDPAFDLAAANDTGVFVLALTSNKEGPQFQHARTADGRTVAQTIVDEVAQRNAGAPGLGSFGLVVGATIGETGTDFANLNGPILSPGVGAQGGTADDVKRLFGDATRNVLPSVSREVLRQGPNVGNLRDALGQLQESFTFLRT
jgi:orotidine-5'-phosphate decarboxylase